MGHKCPKNEPENRLFTTPGPKTASYQSLDMSHDETFMSHRETSDASGNAPETHRKIGDAPGKSENDRKMLLRRPWRALDSRSFLRSRAENHRTTRLGRQPIFVPSPAAPGVPGLKATDSAGHAGLDPWQRRAGYFRRHFPSPRRAPAGAPPAMLQMGHFCLMNEPSSDATNPRSADPQAASSEHEGRSSSPGFRSALAVRFWRSGARSL
jgi:hypothetical protein